MGPMTPPDRTPDLEQTPADEFADVFARIQPRLVRFAARSLGQDEAEDVAAEAMLALWKRYDSSLSEEEIAGAAFSIARGLVLNALRSRRRRSKLFSRVTADPVETRLAVPDIAESITADTKSRVRDYLLSLPPRERQTLALTLDGFKPAEIAAILEISAPTVSASLYRARKALRKLLPLGRYSDDIA